MASNISKRQTTKSFPGSSATDYRHYIPILKSKKGELWALQNVSASEATWLTPLIEIHREKNKAVSSHITKVMESLKAAWNSRKLYMDTRLFGVSGTTAVAHCETILQTATNEGLSFVPVTSIDRSSAYQSVIADHVDNGAMIRLSAGHFADPIGLQGTLSNLVNLLGLENKDVDILIDYGCVLDHLVLIQLVRAHVAALPFVNAWRSVTVAGGSFPSSLAPLAPHAWHNLFRHEWAAWLGAINGLPALVRKPMFGDYGVRDTQPPADFGSPSANIRYTSNGHFMIRRHDVLVKDGGSGGIHAICHSLRQRIEFRGQAFSAGDGQIFITANQSEGPGNAANWTSWGMSHHFGAVVHEIQSLPAA